MNVAQVSVCHFLKMLVFGELERTMAPLLWSVRACVTLPARVDGWADLPCSDPVSRASR